MPAELEQRIFRSMEIRKNSNVMEVQSIRDHRCERERELNKNEHLVYQ